MENNPAIPSTTPNIQAEIPPQAPQQSSRTLWYIGGGIVVLLLIGVLFVVLQKPKTTSVPAPQPTIQLPTPLPKPTLPRSKAPGIITNILTATAVDAQGKAIMSVTTFSKTDKSVYLVLTLNKPKIGTRVEYIRYLNGKYLDSGVNKILKQNVTNTSFIWSLKKPGATHLIGTYKVKVYTNGIFEKETSYTVQ